MTIQIIRMNWALCARVFAIVLLAGAFVLLTGAPRASAQTPLEYQLYINELLAQIASLQGQSPTLSAGVTPSVCPYTWTRRLGVGSYGADVTRLQQFLNASSDTRVAATGNGSPGQESQYFGPLTAAAVAKFQVKYRSEILMPLGLVNPTGYFGLATMAKANALCALTAPTVPVDDDDADETDTDRPFNLRGEASLDRFEISTGDDDEIEEGQENAPVAELDVEFKDGDARITRLDVRLVADGTNDEDEPWDTFESVSLWVDGDMVAEEAADDEDEYLDEDDGTLRFSGFDIVAEEDEEVTIVIAVTPQSSIDGTDDGESWSVSAESMRFFDADDVATTEDSSFDFGDAVDFIIDEEGAEDELVVKSSSDDPDGTTLTVEDSSKSDWYTVFAFDLDTDDSVNDITIDEIPVTVTLSASTTYAMIVDDAELVIDGETFDDFEVSSTTSNAPVLTFDIDGDVEIDAGDRVTAELNLRFRSLDQGNEGTTVRGSVTGTNVDNIDAEGADDLDASQLQGAATGDIHTLRTRGIDVTAEDTDARVTVNDGATDDYATYEIEFEVTAFDQEVYISTNPATSITYVLETGAGAAVPAGSRTVVLSSTADEEGNYFVINEGNSETFTLTVTYVPGVVSTATRLQLETIEFAETSVSPNQSWAASPEEDYRTSVVVVVN